MPASTVVAILDPLADFDASELLGGPHSSVVKLGLQGGEKRLGHRVVPAHPGVTHRAGESVLDGERGDLVRRVLCEFNRWKQHLSV